MRYNKTVKFIAVRAILLVIVTSLSFLCACADFGFGTEMPTEISACTSFENNDYLLIDYFLIDKHSGKISISHWSKEAQKIANELSENSVPSETFSFEVNSLYEHNTTEGKNPTQQAIIDYIKGLYSEDDTNYTSAGIARVVNDKLLFSVTTTNAHGFDSGNGLYEGIVSSKIMSYNLENGQFETVFNCDAKETIILDFDEKGIFTFDVDKELNYYNFETQEITHIWSCPHQVKFIVTDDHICADYEKDSKGHCFVYQKHGEIITDTTYSE